MSTSDLSASEIGARLRKASLLIAAVEVRPGAEGRIATVTLDPLMVKVRAVEQCLKDTSVTAAISDPRIHQTLEVVRRRVSAGLAPDEQIVAIEIVDGVDERRALPDPAPPRSQRELVVASLVRTV